MQNYQSAKNRYKKNNYIEKGFFPAEGVFSGNSKEVWETVHRILDPPKKIYQSKS